MSFTLYNYIDNLKSFSIDREQSQLSTLIFEKREVCSSTGLTCAMILQNAALELGQPILSAHNSAIYFGSIMHGLKPHPICAEIGILAYREIEQHTDCSKRWDLIWISEDDDNLQSVVGCVRIFSDKSQTSLRAEELVFYPLHVPLINFRNWTRQLQIPPSAIVPAYLSVAF